MKRPKLKKIIEKKIPHHMCEHCGVILLGNPPQKEPTLYCYLCHKEHGYGYCTFCNKLRAKNIIDENGSYL
jgi:hypothetical protein